MPSHPVTEILLPPTIPPARGVAPVSFVHAAHSAVARAEALAWPSGAVNVRTDAPVENGQGTVWRRRCHVMSATAMPTPTPSINQSRIEAWRPVTKC